MSDWIGLIETCLEAALIAAAMIATYEGARRLTRDGFGRAPALMLAIGLLAPVVEGGASLRYSASVHLLAGEMPSMNAAEPAGGWEKAAMTPDERALRSSNAARINFLLSGRLVQFVDLAGKRSTFVPNQQDLQDRDSLVRGQRSTESASQHFQERGVQLLSSAAAFMVLGGLIGLFQRRRRPSKL